MAEQFKRHYVTVDMYKTSSDTFEAVEGDTANLIIITLTDRGNPVDLTDCKVLVVFVRGGVPAQQDTDGNGVTISGEHHNIITVDLYSTSYVNGSNTAEVIVLSGEDFERQATSAWFNFKARRARINNSTILAVPQFPLLSQMLETLGNIARGVQAKWSTTITTDPSYIQDKPVIGTDLQAATQNLATVETVIANTASIPILDTTHKRITWLQVKTWLQTLFDTIYAPLSHNSRHVVGATDAIANRYSIAVTATWSGSSAPFTQVVTVSGVTAAMVGKFDIALSSGDSVAAQIAQRDAWRLVDRIDTGAGNVTLTCLEDVPTVAFNLRMECVL